MSNFKRKKIKKKNNVIKNKLKIINKLKNKATILICK